jgi:hypothetical protein
MTKFFAQLLLSLMIGISAAVGFNHDAKEKVVKTWTETKSLVHEATQAALESASDMSAKIKGKSDASVQSNQDAGLAADSESALNAGIELNELTDGVHWQSAVSTVKGSAALESENEASMKTGEARLDLESEIESTLEIHLGN